jgi:hypothetical protein
MSGGSGGSSLHIIDTLLRPGARRKLISMLRAPAVFSLSLSLSLSLCFRERGFSEESREANGTGTWLGVFYPRESRYMWGRSSESSEARPRSLSREREREKRDWPKTRASVINICRCRRCPVFERGISICAMLRRHDASANPAGVKSSTVSKIEARFLDRSAERCSFVIECNLDREAFLRKSAGYRKNNTPRFSLVEEAAPHCLPFTPPFILGALILPSIPALLHPSSTAIRDGFLSRRYVREIKYAIPSSRARNLARGRR